MQATQTAPTLNRRAGRRGEPTELGRYETEGGERRVIVGKRINERVHVFDAPLRAGGTIYPVEAGIESLRELAALVHDYKAQAARYGRVPMCSGFADRVLALSAEDLS